MLLQAYTAMLCDFECHFKLLLGRILAVACRPMSIFIHFGLQYAIDAISLQEINRLIALC